MSSIVSIVKKSILEGNKGENLQLELFPELIPTKDFDKVIFLLCRACIQAKNGEALRDVISYFNQERASLDPLPTLVYLAYNPHVDDALLKDISSYYPEKKFVDYMNDIVPMLFHIEIALPVAKRWESILPASTIEEWGKIKELSESVRGEDEEETLFTDKALHDWISEKYNLIKTTVAPKWIRFKENAMNVHELIKTKPYPLENIPPRTKDAVSIILENIGKCSISYGDQKSVFARSVELLYNIASSQEKFALLYPNQENNLFFDDIEYFTVCGPLNGQSYTAYLEDSFCYYTGGCRMLTCNCHKKIENTEQEFYDMEWIDSELGVCSSNEEETSNPYLWFTGECELCKARIMKPEYALRKPLPEGGWRNCYCGEECLSKVMNLKDNIEDIVLYTRLTEQLDKKGIYVYGDTQN